MNEGQADAVVLNVARMRALEAEAVQRGKISGPDLMERAGHGVVASILAEWPHLAISARRAVVLCGPGNNGGDGFVVARLLRERCWQVEVFLLGDADLLPPNARLNRDRWSALGPIRAFGDGREVRALLDSQGDDPVDILVDAVFGIGLLRAPEGLRALFGYDGGTRGPKRVAVDIPSGLCADSGRTFEVSSPAGADAVLCADLTVTFHRPKPGHYLATGPASCGRLVVVDIGLPPAPDGNDARDIRLTGVRDAPALLGKQAGAHKFTSGHALVLSGGTGRGGAARMAARGALRIGAGLVTVGCPPGALIENAARLDAVMLRPVRDGAALRQMLKDARINVVCLGPGLGVERAAEMLAAALAHGDGPCQVVARENDTRGEDADANPTKGDAARGPKRGDNIPGSRNFRALVLDADALTALSRDAALFDALHDGCVLTPHAGEFARLFPDLAKRMDASALRGPLYSRIDAVRDAAARTGSVVLLKGPDTVIADPSGRCEINAAAYGREAPWLATAGAGDVLAGFITGLLARGFPVFDAAATAAWLHVGCARDFGPGLIAEDLPDRLPSVFRSLGL